MKRGARNGLIFLCSLVVFFGVGNYVMYKVMTRNVPGVHTVGVHSTSVQSASSAEAAP
jgi:hypothetical protein